MWRNSLSFSSKLLTSSNPNFKSAPLLSSISTFNYGVERLVSSPQFFSSGATSPSSTEAVKKLRLPKLDAIRSSGFASSAAAIDTASLAAAPLTLKARWEGADFARHYGRCYWELSKARLSMLVVATSGAGYVLGSGSAIDYVGLCCTCAGTMMVSASANTLNQVFEINNDAKMKRTMLRPLPSGRITIPHAVGWAVSAGAAGTALLAYQTNALAAGLAASNLVLYAFVYTPLKQIHPVNTWVGAVVGAIPPLLGWVAASGQVSLNAMVLPAALYFWQIPHFMALAYLCRGDYAAGGFRMFSLADASGRRTALVALRNCLYLTPLGYIAYDWGIASGWFCVESTILALAIAATSLSFYFNRTTKNARRMFHASLLYLPVFMSGLLLHRIPDDHHQLLQQQTEMMLEQESTTTVSCDKEFKREAVVVGARKQAPVAYASIAPFPFLPAPLMPNPDVNF